MIVDSILNRDTEYGCNSHFSITHHKVDVMSKANNTSIRTNTIMFMPR